MHASDQSCMQPCVCVCVCVCVCTHQPVALLELRIAASVLALEASPAVIVQLLVVPEQHGARRGELALTALPRRHSRRYLATTRPRDSTF